MKTHLGKIAQVISGLMHYAEVEIYIEENGNGKIIEKCNGNGFKSQGCKEDVTKLGCEDWKNAAIEGIRIGLKYIEINEINNNIVILRISGISSDTTENDVKCAGILAICAMYNYTIDENLRLQIREILISK